MAALALSTSAPARIIEPWRYERLMKEADLVVIAAPAKTEPADDRFDHDRWPRQFVGLNTTLDVWLPLKGEPARQIKVLHFALGGPKEGVDPADAQTINDPPMLVTFRTVGAAPEDGVLPIRPQYLLFLRKTKDGRYEPVSGRIDPALSVREVSEEEDARGLDSAHHRDQE